MIWLGSKIGFAIGAAYGYVLAYWHKLRFWLGIQGPHGARCPECGATWPWVEHSIVRTRKLPCPRCSTPLIPVDLEAP